MATSSTEKIATALLASFSALVSAAVMVLPAFKGLYLLAEVSAWRGVAALFMALLPALAWMGFFMLSRKLIRNSWTATAMAAGAAFIADIPVVIYTLLTLTF